MSSSPEPLNGALVNIQESFGALYLGVIASIGLMGITTLQTWIYYFRYPRDLLRLKVMVGVVWTLEFIRCSFAVHAVYHYLVLEWGNPSALTTTIWSVESILLMTHLIELVVHFYFAYRVYVLSRGKWLLSSIICFFTICNFALGITTYAVSTEAAEYSRLGGISSDCATAALACSIATDWMITGSLIFYLDQGRSGLSHTNLLINRLIFYAINIGMLTSMTDIVVLVLSALNLPESLVYLALFDVVGNLYANSLLASLNTRQPVVPHDDDAGVTMSFNTIRSSTNPPEANNQSRTLVHKASRISAKSLSIWKSTKNSVTESMATA